MILRVHLMPALGHKRLDAIQSEDVQHLKIRLSTEAAKTVNDILTVLNVLLKKAVDWDVIRTPGWGGGPSVRRDDRGWYTPMGTRLRHGNEKSAVFGIVGCVRKFATIVRPSPSGTALVVRKVSSLFQVATRQTEKSQLDRRVDRREQGRA